jgi:hypothetical protein
VGSPVNKKQDVINNFFFFTDLAINYFESALLPDDQTFISRKEKVSQMVIFARLS